LSGSPGVTFIAGTAKSFVVNPKTVTLSASKTYDGNTSLTNFVTVTTGVGSQTLTYTGAAANDANVATANKFISAITLADGTNGGLASNYQLPVLNRANAPVTITARPIDITANANQTKVYGDANPSYTYAIESAGANRGLVSGDTFTGALSRASGENVGNYAITQGTLANSNYSINLVSDNFAITRKTITLTAPSVTKAYDGLLTYATTSSDRTAMASSLVAGDTITSAVITYADKNVASGSKTVTLSDVVISDGNGGNNYTVTLAGNNSSSITRQSSVTWIGAGSTGDWFNPANWAVTGNLGVSGAVPDLSNVQAVVIGAGKTVTFADTVAGRTGLAETGTVNITSVSGGGSLTVTNGALSGTSLSLTQLNTSAGTTVTASTGITVAPATGTTDTIAGVVAGGTFTKNGAGTTILTAENTYAGATTITAGVLQVSSDRNLGAVPGSTTAGSLVLNGGSLSATETFTLDSKRGITLGSNAGSLSVADEKVLTYGGVIANASGVTGQLTKSCLLYTPDAADDVYQV
jgi:autotransporter-associated beta strand protein